MKESDIKALSLDPSAIAPVRSTEFHSIPLRTEDGKVAPSAIREMDHFIEEASHYFEAALSVASKAAPK